MTGDGKNRKRGVAVPHSERQDSHWAGAKEQISLDMSSSEYREFVRDQAGIEKEDFVQRYDDVSPAADETVKPTPDLGPDHTRRLAPELREKGSEVREDSIDVNRRKYRTHIAKELQVPGMKSMASEIAASTPETDDDARAAELRKTRADSIPEVHDDGVTPDEFVPKAMRRYM